MSLSKNIMRSTGRRRWERSDSSYNQPAPAHAQWMPCPFIVCIGAILHIACWRHEVTVGYNGLGWAEQILENLSTTYLNGWQSRITVYVMLCDTKSIFSGISGNSYTVYYTTYIITVGLCSVHVTARSTVKSIDVNYSSPPSRRLCFIRHLFTYLFVC